MKVVLILEVTVSENVEDVRKFMEEFVEKQISEDVIVKDIEIIE